MKIGILTYHRAENYGALLQAYAMKTYLQSLGYDVSFVDYWPEYHVEHYRIISAKRLCQYGIMRKVKYVLLKLVWGFPQYVRKRRLNEFMEKKLGIIGCPKYSKENDRTSQYDVVVYGSDQIWRKQDIHRNEFNKWYFGSQNVVANRKIAYAASMGLINTTNEEDKWIQRQLRNFNAISVREQDLCEYLKKMDFNPVLVCDPTLLITKENWRKLYNPYDKGKYILFYNLLNTPESIQYAEALSRSAGLPIREINMKLSLRHFLSSRYISCASIEYFLQLIDGAEYVVSNSFHGVVFSLIFEKQFWAVGMGERSNRAMSLLSSAGIPERYVISAFSAEDTKSFIDYIAVNDHLSTSIYASKQFIIKALA